MSEQRASARDVNFRDFHFYEPSKGSGLRHSPFNSIIAPRPIGWISTRAKNGALNLAPYSFFNAFCYVPPIIGFASMGRKDTLINAEETGEFCWNLVSSELAEAMNATSANVEASVDEFDLAGLSPAPSRIVQAPHVEQSRVVFECRTTQLLPLQSVAGELTGTTVVFGEVVGVHIDQTLFDENGVYQTVWADPVLRGGGPSTYFTLDREHRFDMRRPD